MKMMFWNHFKRNMMAAFVVLAVLKLGSLIYTLGSDESFDSVFLVLAKLPLLLSRDALGSVLVAGLIVALTSPFVYFGRHRGALHAAASMQTVHAFLCVFSTFTLVFQGGHVTKQSIDAAVFTQSGTVSDWLPALWSSVRDYLSVPISASLLVGSALPALLLYKGDAVVRSWPVWLKVWGTRALLALSLVGLLALPYLLSGEIGGVRVNTHGLHESPMMEMGRSYIKPLFRSSGEHAWTGDPFRFDYSSWEEEPAGEAPPPPLAQARTMKTNVLLVVMESVGAVHLGGESDPMPYLTSLANGGAGVALPAHYSAWSLTTHSLFSLMCSELPHPSYKPITQVNPAIGCRSISEVLHDNGYYTAFVTSQDLAYDGLGRFMRHRGFDLLMDMRTMEDAEGAWRGAWGIDDRVAVQKLLQLATEERDRPFFISWLSFSAHHPFVTAPEHETQPLEREAAYRRSLTFLDERLRDLVEGLRAAGRLDDTLIVILADHGEGHGKKAGRNVYETAVHVPLLLVGPQVAGLSPPVGNQLTHHVDVAPTVLGLLGIDVPCTMKGRNLMRQFDPRIAVFGGRPPAFQLGIRDGRWKYILQDDSLDMLFDLYQDPQELNNVAAENPELTTKFRHRIKQVEDFGTNLIEDYGAILQESDCRP